MAIYAAAQQKLAPLNIPGGNPMMPWVDPIQYEAALRAGQAGSINHAALMKSKSVGITV